MRLNIVRAAMGLAGFVAMLVLHGCCAFEPGALIDPLCAKSHDRPVEWDSVLARRLHRPHEDIARLRAEYALESDPARRRHLRDQVALRVLGLIDEHHQRSGIALAGVRAGNDLAADLAVIGLTTAATLTGGHSITSALSAAASATTGANLAINDRFLREQSTSAILAQMDADHLAARERVLANLHTLDDAAYPLAGTDLDLLECLYAGTPVRALASLMDAAALRRADRRR